MRLRTNLVAAICLACWLILAGFPVSGYNSLNESAEVALLLNNTAFEGDQINLSLEDKPNYGDAVDGMLQNLTSVEPSVSGSVDYSNTNANANCASKLSIVDYWGNRYLCNAKCVFLHDVSRMIIVPCKKGLLEIHERYPDNSVQSSNRIPVFANKRYSVWFIGDIEGLHTMWFTVYDRYGRQISQSNDVKYMVVPENCPGIANCSPSSR